MISAATYCGRGDMVVVGGGQRLTAAIYNGCPTPRVTNIHTEHCLLFRWKLDPHRTLFGV